MLGQDRTELRASDFLRANPLFYPVRFCYQCVFDRGKVEFRRKMLKFFSPYIEKGDTVFDVGANIGMYSETFSRLGAKVVAIEPNPRFHGRLRAMARMLHIRVEPCAAGDVSGRAVLYLSNVDAFGTLNPDQKLSTLEDAKRIGTLEVEVKTLDALAELHGVPSFVKIDVEGYEWHVLRGMSFRPRALSFEFSANNSEIGKKCIEESWLTTGYEFNFVRGREMILASDKWVDARSTYSTLFSLLGNEEYGDVIARRRSFS